MKQNATYPSQCGIYQIRCLIHNKLYIGSSKNFKGRRRKHFYQLKRNIHGNKKLQNSYNKHGQQNFVFEILEYVDHLALLKKEQEYLDKYKPAYNISTVAGRPSTDIHGHTEESKEKIRQKSLERRNSPDTLRALALGRKGFTKKAVTSINKLTGECKNYNSMTEAKSDGFCNVCISECCRKKRKTHRGHFWKFTNK